MMAYLALHPCPLNTSIAIYSVTSNACTRAAANLTSEQSLHVRRFLECGLLRVI